jgi:hypothetical protein
MKKIVLMVLILFLSVSADDFEDLKSLSQLKEHKLIFLKFDKNGCPWCARYTNELESGITKKYAKDIKFFRVQKGSEIFSLFRNELKYEILIYPMTYILKLNDKNESEIVHEIYGYQTQEYVEDIFQNKLLIK